MDESSKDRKPVQQPQPESHPLVHASAGGNLAEVKRLLGVGKSDLRRRRLEHDGLITQEVKNEALRVASRPDVIVVLVEQGADDKSIPQDIKDEALRSACENGNVNVVKELLKLGVDVNALKANHGTPLQIACMNGHTEVVKILLKKGAKVDALDGNGNSALILACKYGRLEVVKVLLASGANVNITGKESPFTAVSTSFSSNKADIIRLLLENKSEEAWANYWETFESVSQVEGATPVLSHAAVARLLGLHVNNLDASLDRGKDEALEDYKKRFMDKAQLSVRRVDKQRQAAPVLHGVVLPPPVVQPQPKSEDVGIKNQEALCGACRSGDVGAVKKLLENGSVNVNALDKEGDLPFTLACISGHTDVVNVLLDSGADINLRDRRGLSPFHHANYNDKPAVMRILLQRGADVSVKAWVQICAAFTPQRLEELKNRYPDIYDSIKKYIPEQQAAVVPHEVSPLAVAPVPKDKGEATAVHPLVRACEQEDTVEVWSEVKKSLELGDRERHLDICAEALFRAYKSKKNNAAADVLLDYHTIMQPPGISPKNIVDKMLAKYSTQLPSTVVDALIEKYAEVIHLYDVDGTLISDDGAFKDDVIDRMVAEHIKGIYLFSRMGAGSFKPEGVTRLELIHHLEAKGISVLGVVTSNDKEYNETNPSANKAVGAFYEMYLRPAEALRIQMKNGEVDEATGEAQLRELADKYEEARNPGYYQEQRAISELDKNTQQEEIASRIKVLKANRPHEGEVGQEKAQQFEYAHSALHAKKYVFTDDAASQLNGVRDAAERLGVKVEFRLVPGNLAKAIADKLGKANDKFSEENQKKVWDYIDQLHSYIKYLPPEKQAEEWRIVFNKLMKFDKPLDVFNPGQFDTIIDDENQIAAAKERARINKPLAEAMFAGLKSKVMEKVGLSAQAINIINLYDQTKLDPFSFRLTNGLFKIASAYRAVKGMTAYQIAQAIVVRPELSDVFFKSRPLSFLPGRRDFRKELANDPVAIRTLIRSGNEKILFHVVDIVDNKTINKQMITENAYITDPKVLEKFIQLLVNKINNTRLSKAKDKYEDVMEGCLIQLMNLSNPAKDGLKLAPDLLKQCLRIINNYKDPARRNAFFENKSEFSDSSGAKHTMLALVRCTEPRFDDYSNLKGLTDVSPTLDKVLKAFESENSRASYFATHVASGELSPQDLLLEIVAKKPGELLITVGDTTERKLAHYLVQDCGADVDFSDGKRKSFFEVALTEYCKDSHYNDEMWKFYTTFKKDHLSEVLSKVLDIYSKKDTSTYLNYFNVITDLLSKSGVVVTPEMVAKTTGFDARVVNGAEIKTLLEQKLAAQQQHAPQVKALTAERNLPGMERVEGFDSTERDTASSALSSPSSSQRTTEETEIVDVRNDNNATGTSKGSVAPPLPPMPSPVVPSFNFLDRQALSDAARAQEDQRKSGELPVHKEEPAAVPSSQPQEFEAYAQELKEQTENATAVVESVRRQHEDPTDMSGIESAARETEITEQGDVQRHALSAVEALNKTKTSPVQPKKSVEDESAELLKQLDEVMQSKTKPEEPKSEEPKPEEKESPSGSPRPGRGSGRG